MTERAFEARLERVLRADAERAVRPIDPVQLALDAASAPTIRRLDWRPASWPAIRLVLIVSLLVLAAVATLWLVGAGSPSRPSLVDVVPSAPPATASDGQLLAELANSSWIAPTPAGLAIAGSAVVDPFVIAFDNGGGQAYLPIGSGREKLASTTETLGPNELRFVTRPGAGDEVEIAGEQYRPCTAGEEGTYRVAGSSDGLLMTLEPLAEACPSREAVLSRTWTRYLGRPNRGGIGVVDAFDPVFAVQLPPGSYLPNDESGVIVLRQEAPEFEFLGWKDPQGFNDPCDPLGSGRRPVADAADFVEYFQNLDGFTVDAVEAVQLDGRPATHLTLHANPDASCPAGWLAQWQPASITGDRYWLLRPGDSDSLYLVDLADATLMFEVLGPQELEDQIIPSIRLLEDGLPTSP